jgi:hypothetical protein
MSAHQSTTGTAAINYDGSMLVRCPKSLPVVIKLAAQNQMTNSSSYVRSAILKQLRLDGYNLNMGELGQ